VVVVLGGTSPSMRDRKVADLLTNGFKTQRGTGTLIAAKAPQAARSRRQRPLRPTPPPNRWSRT
jgi:D-alanyl-D-alanine carboxypeptidase